MADGRATADPTLSTEQRRRQAVDLFNRVWTGTEERDLPFAYEELARAHAVAEEPFESRRFEQ